MELKRLEKQILLFEKANKTLQKVFEEQNNFSELEKDGVIQRFEYTIEIGWKTLKKVLEYEKLNSSKITDTIKILKTKFINN